MDTPALTPNWSLSSLFQKSFGPEQVLDCLPAELDRLEHQTASFPLDDARMDPPPLIKIIETISFLQQSFSQLSSYTVCVLAEQPGNHQGKELQSRMHVYQARFTALVQQFHQLLSQIDESNWSNLIKTKELQETAFLLQEWRNQGFDISRHQQGESSITLYHSLGQNYRTIVDRLRVPFEMDGQEQELSLGQAINLRSHPSRTVRKQAHHALEAIWGKEESQMADLLNGMIGFRLSAGAPQSSESPLEDALRDNRLKKESLSAMWKAVNAHKPAYAAYLQAKARLLGQSRLASYDFWAPVSTAPPRFSYPEAADLLLTHFKGFGTEMANFAELAFGNRWIEAENRPGKSAIAFCAGFPKSKESRVFMTYEGSFMNILTLAHELGHAFHNDALKDEMSLFRKYPMSLAETASTFAELIVLDSALSQSPTDRDKLFFLDEKIKRSTMNFMTIQARFLFEQRLCTERENGAIPISRINCLMQEAFEEAFGGSMDEQPVHAWMSTPHFYITTSPFYNFPYSFGYLFAVNLYARAREEGPDFEMSYLALLRDSGKMPAEELVLKHLGEDITMPAFWEKGMSLCLQDIEEFIKLADRI